MSFYYPIKVNTEPKVVDDFVPGKLYVCTKTSTNVFFTVGMAYLCVEDNNKRSYLINNGFEIFTTDSLISEFVEYRGEINET